jgi:hypothetical protein
VRITGASIDTVTSRLHHGAGSAPRWWQRSPLRIRVAQAADEEETYVPPAVWSELDHAREPAPEVEASGARVPIGHSWLWNRWSESEHCQQLCTVCGELGRRPLHKGAADSLTALA